MQCRGEELAGRVIVLLGFENICADFELIEGHETKKSESSFSGEEVQEQIDSITVDISQESEEDAKLRMAFMQSLADDDDDDDDDDDEFFDPGEVEGLLKGFSLFETSAKGSAEKKTQDEEKTDESKLYNAKEDLKYIVQHGSRKGIHFLLYLNTYADLKQTGLREDFFKHRMAFRIPADDSKQLFGNSAAANLPDHICMYSDRLDRFSFRPYLHQGISWDGWGVDEEGNVINPLN